MASKKSYKFNAPLFKRTINEKFGTIESAAEIIGVDHLTVKLILAGMRQPNLNTFCKTQKALELPFEELVT